MKEIQKTQDFENLSRAEKSALVSHFKGLKGKEIQIDKQRLEDQKKANKLKLVTKSVFHQMDAQVTKSRTSTLNPNSSKSKSRISSIRPKAKRISTMNRINKKESPVVTPAGSTAPKRQKKRRTLKKKETSNFHSYSH
eukprot:UN27165